MNAEYLKDFLAAKTVTFFLVAAVVVTGGAAWVRSPGNPAKQRSERSPTTSAPAFTDVTASSGITFAHVSGEKGEYWLPEEMGHGGAFIDYDDDGDLDVYLVQGGDMTQGDDRHRNQLYRNVGGGRFEDVSEGSGADIPGYGMGCAAADYDNDGDVDIYVTRLGPDVLLQNNGGGRFTDASSEVGINDNSFGVGAAFLDYDRDGLLDLFVVNYVDWSPPREHVCYDPAGNRDYCGPTNYPPATSTLYHNLSGGRFEDVTAKSGIGGTRGFGLGILCSDFDGDGWVDVYVANDQSPGFLWINRHDGTFEESGAMRGCAYNADGMAIAGMGTAAEDLDDDGDYDIVTTNIAEQPHLFLRNDSGYFTDMSRSWVSGSWSIPYTGFGIAIFDQDHDGVLDGLVANGAVNRRITPLEHGRPFAEPNQFLRRDSAGRFYDAKAEVGLPDSPMQMSRAAIVGDCDNDGDLDLVVTNNRGAVQLLRNDAPAERAWTMLDLRPAGGSRHAINARIEVEAGGRIYRREVRPHASYLASNDPRLHVGLDKATIIDRLRVTWADGATEDWTRLPVRRHLKLTQGQSPKFTALEDHHD